MFISADEIWGSRLARWNNKPKKEGILKEICGYDDATSVTWTSVTIWVRAQKRFEESGATAEVVFSDKFF